jgi:hypothetical protein
MEMEAEFQALPPWRKRIVEQTVFIAAGIAAFAFVVLGIGAPRSISSDAAPLPPSVAECNAAVGALEAASYEFGLNDAVRIDYEVAQSADRSEAVTRAAMYRDGLSKEIRAGDDEALRAYEADTRGMTEADRRVRAAIAQSKETLRACSTRP